MAENGKECSKDLPRERSRSRSPVPSASKETAWLKGSEVQFFHAADPSFAYASYRCPIRAPCCAGPRFLQSHGWLHGTLVEDFLPENFVAGKRNTWPMVMPSPDIFFTDKACGKLESTVANGARRVAFECIRKPSSKVPLLSLVFVRWGGEDAVHGPRDSAEANDGDWGNYGAPASDDYMSSFIKQGLMAHPRLGSACKNGLNFEVYSLFCKDSADVKAIGSLAPWMVSCLNGKKKTAFWMMWPSEWIDTRGADYAAYIERHAFFSGMRAIEAAGIRTGFPHPADQYEQITSKSWMATLSMQPQARLPAATMVSKAVVLSDAKRAARLSLAALEYVRSQNPFPISDGEPPAPSVINKDSIQKGVVKLGWSWEARYVSIFHSEEDLAVKLTEMMTHSGCLASTCIVQEWVDFDFEMRLYFLPPEDWDPAKKLQPTRIECNAWSGSMENGQRRSFHKLNKEKVLLEYWKDDEEAYKSAKKQAVNTAQYLLGWLLLNEAQPVPMIRLDFMLKRLGPGNVRVFFGEYCEMGACCLGWEEGPPTIWRQALDCALR